MRWEIPVIPNKTKLTPPKYKPIIAAFTLLIGGIYTYSLTLSAEQKAHLLLLTVPAILLIGFILLAFLYIRYQHSLMTHDNWENEKDLTKSQWQSWSQSSIMSIANVIYTPDKQGTDVFLTHSGDIPMFPEKPRPLLQEIDEELFSEIHQKIEKQCKNYRNTLSVIYLICHSGINSPDVLVFNQWHLKPILLSSFEPLFLNYDNENRNTFLVVTIQQDDAYSHFVSAQLFSQDNKICQSANQLIAIERVMTFDSNAFGTEFNKFVNYSGISRKNFFQTWLSNISQPQTEIVLLGYAENQIDFNRARPINSINLSYAKAHPNAFFTYLSLVSDIAQKTKTDQVLVHITPDNTGYAVYISDRS
ncbi:hypothetical protein [Providencia sp.]|uniref:hypothetical protein n=1 Tax=Providencia sp. TaxID=589 RepID=UPI003341633E